MAGSGSATSSHGSFPSDFPEAIANEITLDIDADPDPSGATAVMSVVEAQAVSATPDGRSPLDICRARRTTMIGYLNEWSKMSPAERQALAAASASWGSYPGERCSYAFDQANGFALASRKAKEKRDYEALKAEVVEELHPASTPIPIATRRVSAEECRWWQDEADRNRREAGRATTRNLRQGWDHNEEQAMNAYREFCR